MEDKKIIDEKPIGYRYAIGTKAIRRLASGRYAVQCATCDIGSRDFGTFSRAFDVATSGSGNRCRSCGAN